MHDTSTMETANIDHQEDNTTGETPSDSLGSLSDDDEALQSDTWIEELECALLADCDPATLKKISQGKRIPASLRPDYWRTLLFLNDTDKVKLSGEYDLVNQNEIRLDCEQLVNDITTLDDTLSDVDKLRLKSDFESTITTYVKARPELQYVSGNGWIDILKVLYNLNLSDTQMYQMFFRIVDRYIPRDLSPAPSNIPKEEKHKESPSKVAQNKSEISTTSQKVDSKQPLQRSNVSTQAYHLLRLLIQYHDPELCSILDSRKVTPNLYVKDWFCSLFARSCSMELALYIWDMHFKMADPFLIFFAAIVMVVNASDELKKSNKNQAEMLNVLKAMPSKLVEDDIEDLYYLVSNHYTNSTPRSIRSYSHLFFMDTFGNTYMGNESPEDGPSLMDLKTTRLTSSIDLSQYLCLPIVPAEIFAIDTAQQRSSPTQSNSTLRYFLVDCRPAEQYNAGHLTKAFHLDCSLMLREPSSFSTAVQALLEIQRQVVASKSNTGGQHLCFIGSGQEEEDRYVNMVVASFLQKYQKYVCIVHGGFEAIHDYVQAKSDLKESFNKYIVDHDENLCKTCYSKSPDGMEKLRLQQQQQREKIQASASSGGFTSAQSLFASTTNFFKSDKSPLNASTFTKLAANPQAAMLTQSGASMFDKFASAFVSKSNVIKDRLVETLNTTNLPSPTVTATSSRSHVSSQDKLGPRYTGGSFKYGQNDAFDELTHRGRTSRKHGEDAIDGEPCQEVQIGVWQKENNILALYQCAQIKGTQRYPGYLALTKTHLWILREIPHNKGFASIAAKRPLDMIIQITSKRRQPDFIIFRYGYAHGNRRLSEASGGNKSPDEGGQGNQQSSQDDPTASGQNDDKESSKVSSKESPTIIASDHLHIPQAFEVIRLIKREIVRIMDENSNKRETLEVSGTESADKSNVEASDTKQEEQQEEGDEGSFKEDDTSAQLIQDDSSENPIESKIETTEAPGAKDECQTEVEETKTDEAKAINDNKPN